MNQKEVNELRRRWRPGKNNVNHIYERYLIIPAEAEVEVNGMPVKVNKD